MRMASRVEIFSKTLIKGMVLHISPWRYMWIKLASFRLGRFSRLNMEIWVCRHAEESGCSCVRWKIDSVNVNVNRKLHDGFHLFHDIATPQDIIFINGLGPILHKETNVKKIWVVIILDDRIYIIWYKHTMINNIPFTWTWEKLYMFRAAWVEWQLQ